VQIPKTATDKTGKVLILKKNIPEEIFQKIIFALNRTNTRYEILKYGNFSHDEYLNKLRTALLMIYLQTSESQGLALQEAWSYNVPTLVWQNTDWIYGKYTWTDSKISAPYLTDDCGLFFTVNNFEEVYTKIRAGQINPQNYCREHLSDKKSAQLFLDIIKKHHEKS
jgi:hypothetical protein